MSVLYCDLIDECIDGGDCIIVCDVVDDFFKETVLEEKFKRKRNYKEICKNCKYHNYQDDRHEEE